jgi:hypothetical protein
MTRKKALDWWKTKRSNCEVTRQALKSTVIFLIVEECILLRQYTIKHANQVTLLATIYLRVVKIKMCVVFARK